MSAQENLDEAARLADTVLGAARTGSETEALAEALRRVTTVVTNLHLQVEALTGRLQEVNGKMRELRDILEGRTTRDRTT